MRRLFGIISIVLALVLCLVPGLSGVSFAADSNETIIYNFLINEIGLNTAQACGILANIHEESRFIPTASCIDVDGYESYGLCQWHVTRLDALKDYCNTHKLDYKTVRGQMEYLKYELNTTEKYAYSMILGIPNNADGAYTAAYNWTKYFGRGATQYYDYRGNLAKTKYWPKYGGNSSEKIYSTIAEGTYYLKNNSKGTFVTVPTKEEKNGADVALGTLQQNNYFKLIIKKATYGYVIKPKYTSTSVVNIWATIVESGKNVTLYTPTGSTSQEWYFDVADGGYAILSVQKPEVGLDLSGNSVIVKTYNQSATQIWTLVPADLPTAVTPTATSVYEGEYTSISWNASQNANAYDVTIKNTSNGASAYSSRVSETSLSVMLPAGDYTVKVDALNTELIPSGGSYMTAGSTVPFTVTKPHVHDFSGRHETVTEPNCTETGLERIYCVDENCGEFITAEIPANGHDFYEQFTHPTKSTSGSIIGICNVCKYSETIQTIPASGDTLPLITVMNTDAPAGQKVTVKVALSNFDSITSGEFTISYNADILTLKKARGGAGIKVSSSGNKITFTKGTTTGEQLLFFEFLTSDGASGTIDVSVDYEQNAFVSGGAAAYPGIEDGSVKIVPIKGYYGDIDSDGYITAKDIISLRLYIAGLEDFKTFNAERADANRDGNVDMRDVVLMRLCMAGLDSIN